MSGDQLNSSPPRQQRETTRFQTDSSRLTNNQNGSGADSDNRFPKYGDKQDEATSSRFATDPESLNALKSKTMVKEYVARSERDMELPVLRSLFIESFDDFYKLIEPKLQLRPDISLRDWLDETFNEMQEEMITKQCRVFLLTTGSAPSDIIGFMQIKEENNTNTVYVSQVAAHASLKRKGFGALLLRYLISVYPPGKTYTGLCRRANDPALQFYMKKWCYNYE
ncbi:unnamed protein product [Didymodactylos carnosus]|uniref:N-acetyltransferase domain-containing protein n=1 Tax=Didymodactylos carnosus TaxID=1234261 RepID=A0A816D2I6_9BILA|nr:unnamed protein product [Didymodactylos carnosus]CAF4526485.1 unnamed protein product [Didymodactylos carnosus]